MIALLMFMSCSTPLECGCLDDHFVDRWWQIYISDRPVEDCYLFSKDGYVVKRNGDGNTPIGQWAVKEEKDCVYTIETTEDDGDKKELTLLGYAEECWTVEVEDDEYTACECSID